MLFNFACSLALIVSHSPSERESQRNRRDLCSRLLQVPEPPRLMQARLLASRLAGVEAMRVKLRLS